MKSLLLTFAFWILLVDLSGQAISFMRLMEQDSALDLYLKLDWKKLAREKKDKAYLPASIRMESRNGDTISMNLKARTRGNMRLNICSQPPIKLKFDKADLTKRSLSVHNEIDLVRPCHEGEPYVQFILKEFLAYKLYQEISPYNYHVQLIKLHFLNEDETMANDPTYAFMVENTEELVDRVGAKRNKTELVSKNGIDKEALLRLCLFEYMIGNTDWFIRNRHNLEFIAVPGFSLLVPVPYDFDYSGIVAAPYASHHESIGESAITARYYQGLCEQEAEVLKQLQLFKDRKERLLEICDNIQGMNERALRHTRDYLEEFFDIIENPKKTESFIIKHCDMWPAMN